MSEASVSEFQVSVERLGGTAVVSVCGELDLATAPALSDTLAALERPCDRVILDVSGLGFIDSTGVQLAVAEYQRARADGFDLVIAGAADNVMKVFRLTGLHVTLPLAPDVASALE
jgi:anti-anti-sigma factor